MNATIIVKQTASLGWNVIVRKDYGSGRTQESVVASFSSLGLSPVLVVGTVKSLIGMFMADDIQIEGHDDERGQLSLISDMLKEVA